MNSAPEYAQTTDDNYTGQPAWGTAPSDSLQYELFFGDRFLSIRAFKFPTSTFAYAWIYDSAVQNLFSSYEPLMGKQDGLLACSNSNLSYEWGEGGGSIELHSSEGRVFGAEIEETVSTLWRFPPDDIVIHQPLLHAKLRSGTESWTGTGYCKRYSCGAGNEHMYWRFMTGPLDEAQGWFWTAEAAFNLKKYDYFKTASADGTVLTAEQPGTWHRDRMARGLIGGEEHRLEFEDIGRIEYEIREGPTNVKISQAFCRSTFRRGADAQSGYALNEIACGIHA